MRFIRLAAAGLSAIGLTAAAHATPITYTLTGLTFQTPLPNPVTGTVTIDTTSDKVVSANILYNGVSFSTIGSPNAYSGLGQDYITAAPGQAMTGQVALYYTTANIGTGSLNICDGPCGTSSGQSYLQIYTPSNLMDAITGGKLTPAATVTTTPEPSGLALLGTGALAAMGAARRRYLKA